MTVKQLRQIKLSQHFSANEIFFSSGIWEVTLAENPKLQKIQFFLAETLCQNLLESIRAIACKKRKGSIISILGGCRNGKSHENMIATNWIKPSKTSDHSYMNDYYPLGVGAVDIVVPQFDAKEMEWLFKEAVKKLYGNKFGQIIFYPDSQSKFIHISNPKTILREVGELIQIMELSKRLIYQNGTYNSYRL